MIFSRSWLTGRFVLVMLAGIGFVPRSHAGPENVGFPENYAKGVKWLIADRSERRELHEHYVTPGAIEAARKGDAMPNGTVFTVVRYAAALDEHGNPRRGADGHFVKGEIVGYGVMEKRAGWGGEYPASLRNGEWEYRVFTRERMPNTSMKLTACFECHKAEAAHDYVQAYEKLRAAAP